jgi:branched-chain amino acid aminotransferase
MDPMMIVCINGEFVAAADAKISVFDHGLLYGDGVFETIAAVGGRIFWLDEHIDRLRASCSTLRLAIPWGNKELSGLAAETFRRTHEQAGRIRITITRGIGGVPIDESPGCTPNLIIFSSKLEFFPGHCYESGIKLTLADYGRPYPAAKNLSFVPSVMAHLMAAENGYDEALFVDGRGNVLEGSTSNLFVVKHGRIKTPTEGILVGVTRNKVIDLADELGLVVEEANVKLAELVEADEAFITGTTKRILPAVRIGDRKIGDGRPGKVTLHLMSAFARAYF